MHAPRSAPSCLSLLCALLTLGMVLCPAAAQTPAPTGAPAGGGRPPIRLVLVGDSTVAERTGWGPGFKACLGEGLLCFNAARNGRSSKSYRAEGLWAKALALKGDYYLIQFGHNDQPGKGPDRETDPDTTYYANMARYVAEVRALGARPILVTSLTRRDFESGHPGKIRSTLWPYVRAVERLAAAEHVTLIDLHGRSLALCEQMGPAWASGLNPLDKGKPDTTHLNARGSAIFGRLMAEELARAAPELAPYLRLDQAR